MSNPSSEGFLDYLRVMYFTSIQDISEPQETQPKAPFRATYLMGLFRLAYMRLDARGTTEVLKSKNVSHNIEIDLI
jgi:hypothetical protein